MTVREETRRLAGQRDIRLAPLAIALVMGACSDSTAPGNGPPPSALLACLDRRPEGEPGCAITPDSSHATMPEVSGDRIVWQDYRSGPPTIFLLDLGTLAITQVSPPRTVNALPVVDGDRIVYVQFLDFSTSMETRVTTDPAEQADPSIHGEIITWLDRRRRETWWDVHLLDLATGAERRLTQDAPTAGRGPVVSAERVIWGDTRGGYFTLHEATLPDQPARAVATPLLENGLAASPSGRYAGVYLTGALLWMALVDRVRPDRWDLLGATLTLTGALVILYAPRVPGGTP